MTRRPLFLLTILFLAACAEPSRRVIAGVQQPPEKIQLPTGNWIDPVGTSVQLGSMPLAIAVSPRGDRMAVQLSGWREQGVQIVERATGRLLQTITVPASFLGATFSGSGDTLYLSGGFHDLVYEIVFRGGRAEIADSISLAAEGSRRRGRYYPAGLALSPNGKQLYVAENLSDSLAVIDVAKHAVVQRLPLGRYPYAVAVTRGGKVFASAWGGNGVAVYDADEWGMLTKSADMPAGRHPSALLLNRDNSRLFVVSASTDRVAVLDPRTGKHIAELRDDPPNGPEEGSTPNALALSPDGTRLYVAEADNNAVAVFDLSASTSGIAAARGNDALAGRVPVEWYPTALASVGDTLFVVNGKGRGTAANPDGPTPYHPREEHPRSYTLGQLNGTLMPLRASSFTRNALAVYTARVTAANRWNVARGARTTYPPFEHVIYVIKENRTFDEVLGDLPGADGDTSLVIFGRKNTPNHHALAERFGIFDRFFVNAEVSGDGHSWSTAAYASDYVEKTVESHYSARGRTYDYEGLNHNRIPDDDVNEPSAGYLWDLAQRAHVSVRNYGEYVSPKWTGGATGERQYIGNKPFLNEVTDHEYPGFNLDITDQHRMDIWTKALEQFDRDGTMPQLEIMRLPNDHTAALKGGSPTPRAYVADNDLAFGRMIAALTKSPYWKNTVVFVLEDDAQNGPDHVDSHRSELFVISAYNAPGVYHRFVNTTDVIATIAEILHMGSLSQFDYHGRPLRDIWASKPNLAPYAVLQPGFSLTDRNPPGGKAESESSELDLSAEDRADEDSFNRILWKALKGTEYPGVRRASVLDVRRGQ